MSYLWTFRQLSILHVLIKKLLNLEVNPDLILWIRQFLCDRPQRVRLNGSLSRDPVLSDEVIINTGAPQGCVLSPILFSIYTNDISCNNSFLTLIKYADDMALVGRLKDELSLFEYRLQIDALASQFTSTFLKLIFCTEYNENERVSVWRRKD